MTTDGVLMRLTKQHFIDLIKEPSLHTVDYVTGQKMVGGGARWLDEHPAIDGAWPERSARPGADVLVAHIGEVVVGYLVADLASDHIVRIDQVWVEPEARELGFGDALLALAIERARAEGAIAVEGQSLPGDRQTKNLYERAGIVARLITTYRAL